MLTSLTVKQFALIESVHLELESGMTVFTGETGAGKSMLVDALGAVFGARATVDWVRHGADKAEITAVLEAEDQRLQAVLEAADIDCEDEMILRRIVTKDGRSRATINGTPVVLKTLQQIGRLALDLHGQHEHQSLMHASVQKQLLDSRIDAKQLQPVRDAYADWMALKERLHAMNNERGETEQQAAWMREELNRLELLEVEAGLADALQMEVDAGRHHAQIQQAAAEALFLLDEGEPSARELIAKAAHALSGVEGFHEGLKAGSGLIGQIDALLGELSPELRTALEQPFDELQLQQAEERLMALHELMRRHACDEAGLLVLMQQWQQKLTALDTAGWDEASVMKALDAAAEQYREHASALSAERQACGEQLVKQLRPFLDQLALAGMQVRFQIQEHVDESGWAADGRDEIRMQVMSNPGEPWRDLATVASGGELSRLVLALKGCGILTDMPFIAVFDEVDTGIGGETAWCVGEMLASMGSERQVLVISHLPQVAACAHHQVVISKSEKEGRTVTNLATVDAQSRQCEIARMLGGAGEQSLTHAREMLQRGGIFA